MAELRQRVASNSTASGSSSAAASNGTARPNDGHLDLADEAVQPRPKVDHHGGSAGFLDLSDVEGVIASIEARLSSRQ